MSAKSVPCPFCGGSAAVQGVDTNRACSAFVRCALCGMRSPTLSVAYPDGEHTRPEDLGELEGAALRLFGSIRFDAKGDE